MQHQLYYKNHLGEKLYLNEAPYFLQSENLFNYEWLYEAENDGKRGGRITQFYREITEFSVKLVIKAITNEDFVQAMNKFFEVAEKDVLAKTPGRLVTNDDQYMICYMTSREKTEWSRGLETSIDDVKIVSERPLWCRDYIYDFRNHPEYAPGDVSYLDFPYDFPYDLTPELQGQSIFTDHVAVLDSDLKIIMEGPIANPYVDIGDNHYEVHVNLSQNDYMILDTKTKTIKVHKADGTVVDAFNSRAKEYENFAKIGAGRHYVATNTSIEITIYEERSEPLWSF